MLLMWANCESVSGPLLFFQLLELEEMSFLLLIPPAGPAVTGCVGDRKQDCKMNREPAIPAWLLSRLTLDSHLPYLSLGLGPQPRINVEPGQNREYLGVFPQIRYVVSRVD